MIVGPVCIRDCGEGKKENGEGRVNLYLWAIEGWVPITCSRLL